jgi:cytochrome P450
MSDPSAAPSCTAAHGAPLGAGATGERSAARRGGGLPPGPRGLPFLGNALAFRRDELGYLLALQRTYGRMATIHIGKTPVVQLFRPEHVRDVLVDRSANFTTREVAGGLVFGNLLVLSLLTPKAASSAIQGLRDIVGDGLLTTDGPYHDRHRRLLQPAFTRARVESHAGLIVRYTDEALRRWQPGADIDATAALQALILRVTMQMLIDVDVAAERNDIGQLIEGMLANPVTLLEGLLNLRIDLPFLPFGRRMRYKRRADAYIERCIDERLAAGRDHGDILSMLLQASRAADDSLTRRHIRDELINLTAAGHETSTNTLAWTLYLLAEHPRVLGRVRAELRQVLGGRPPAAGDLPRLTYLDCAIKESMRLYPSAWTQGRRAIDAFDLDGYRLPAGTLLMFSQWVIHRLPDIWGDPDTYRPERWLSDETSALPQWAYFPFGAGSRMCLGQRLAEMQIRLVLARMLQRYVPRLVPGHPVVPLPLVTLRLRYGLRLRVESAAEA